MEVIYTRHAKSRMRWREISKDEVELTIKDPEVRENVGINRFQHFKHIESRYIRVTCAIEGKKCIIISAVDKSD